MQLGLTVLVTWFVVSRVGLGLDDLRAIDRRSWAPRPAVLAAASALLLSAYGLSSWIWGRMVHDLGGPKLGVRTSVPVFMVANLGRYVPGKIWQIAGLATLARVRGVPVPVATGAAVMGQGVALAAASAVGVPALLQSPDPYPTWGWIVLALIVVGLGAASHPGLYDGLVRGWFRLARAETPAPPSTRHGRAWFVLYVMNWILYAAAFWIFTLGLGLGGPAVLVASSFAAAYVAGYVMVFAPAGLGPREGLLIAFLAPHMGAGPASFVAVAARVWTTVVEVVPAAFFWLLTLRKMPGAARIDPTDRADAGPGSPGRPSLPDSEDGTREVRRG